jgi:uncharacterized protein
MTLIHLILNQQTKLPRSGWRALLFAAILTLPNVLLSSFAGSGTPVPISANAGFIFTYGVLVLWAVLVSWCCLRFLERLNLRALGVTWHYGWWRDVAWGVLIAALMMSAVVGLQMLGGGTRFTLNPAWRNDWLASSSEWLAALLLFALAGAFEELLYRGYAFQTLLRGLPPLVPLLLLSLLFGVGHWENPHRTSFSTLNTVLAGIWLAVAYLKTRSLWLPMALHCTWNWTMGAFFGLPVSGLRIPQQPILLATNGEPVWLTGGNYGSEGGAATTAVFIIAILIIWRARWLTVAPEVAAAWTNEPRTEDEPIKLDLLRE